MSQGSRPSYLDYAEDNDDVLNKSWDVDSRHRLQENALKLQRESSDGPEVLFRARVELGLHELTAALSSLRYGSGSACSPWCLLCDMYQRLANKQFTQQNTPPPDDPNSTRRILPGARISNHVPPLVFISFSPPWRIYLEVCTAVTGLRTFVLGHV